MTSLAPVLPWLARWLYEDHLDKGQDQGNAHTLAATVTSLRQPGAGIDGLADRFRDFGGYRM